MATSRRTTTKSKSSSSAKPKSVSKPAGRTTAKASKSKAPAAKGTSSRTPSKTTARAKPIKHEFFGPEDFRSCFVEVSFSIDKDGFLAPGTTVEAIKGKPDNENAPRYDLVLHDPDVAVTLVSRISMLVYVTNAAKRLPAGTQYVMLVRATVSAAKGGEVRTGVKSVYQVSRKGAFTELDKKSPESRRLRRCGKFLAPAFQNALSMDSLKQLQAEYERSMDESEDEDDAE